MNDQEPPPPLPPQPRASRAPFIWALVLTLLPAVGSLLGNIDDGLVIVGFFSTPLLSLAAGIVLGIRTGKTPGMKVLLTLLWGIGSATLSLLAQAGGCALVQYKLNLH